MKKARPPSGPKTATIPVAVEARDRDWPRVGLGAAAIVLLVLAVYYPALRGPFVWDDPIMVDENPLVNRQANLLSVWFTGGFPLSSAAFWLQWLAWGKNPIGYHLVNMLLHGLGAVLLWRVLLRLKVPGSWLAGVVFAAHPVCVASVAWISELKNTLSLPLYLLSLLWYLRFDSELRVPTSAFRVSKWYGFSLLAFLLAGLTKTSVVMLPVVLLGCAWWQRGRVTRRDLVRSAPYFALALLLGLTTVWFQFHQAMKGEAVQTEGFWGRLAGAGWAVWFYLGKAVWPVKLSMNYPRWEIDAGSPLAYVPLVLLGAVFMWLWRFRGTWGRHALLGLGCFAVTLFPVLGFFDMYYLVYSRVADHWQYLPLTGLVGLVVGAASWWMSKRLGVLSKDASLAAERPANHAGSLGWVRPGVAGGLVMVLAVLSWRQAGIFASEEALWSDTIRKNPAAWCAQNNLGNTLAGQGRTEEAMALYRDALRANPNSADAHNNLGLVLVKQNKIDEAVAQHAEAVRLKPPHPKYQFNLGIALARQNKLSEATAHYTTALRLQPLYADVHNNLANVLLRQGKSTDAMDHCEAALRLKPFFPEAHLNAANALSVQGKTAEAAAHFTEAIQLRPDFAEAHYSLGILLAEQGRLKEAADHFAETVRISPANAGAHGSLGNALAGLKRLDEAITHYQEALRLAPEDPQTHNNLANALAEQGKLAEAVQQYTAAIKLNNEDPEPHYNLSLVLTRLDQREEALKQVKEALRLRPSYAQAQRQLDVLRTQSRK